MKHKRLMEREAIKHSALLYVEFIADGIESDMLRGQIHKQITHIFEKLDLGDEADKILHNLDINIELTPDQIKLCKISKAAVEYYGELLAERLYRLRLWGV